MTTTLNPESSAAPLLQAPLVVPSCCSVKSLRCIDIGRLHTIVLSIFTEISNVYEYLHCYDL